MSLKPDWYERLRDNERKRRMFAVEAAVFWLLGLITGFIIWGWK